MPGVTGPRCGLGSSLQTAPTRPLSGEVGAVGGEASRECYAAVY